MRVPRGFVSDGVTSPRWAWWLLPPWGHGATRAAILHDWGLQLLRVGEPHPCMPTRAAVDAEFRRALAACGVPAALAGLMWLAVRLAAIRAALGQRLGVSARA